MRQTEPKTAINVYLIPADRLDGIGERWEAANALDTGSPIVGRGSTAAEAVGDLLLNNPHFQIAVKVHDNRIGRFTITRSMLCDLLNLPKGTKIKEIRQSTMHDVRDIEVRVVSPSLAPVPEGTQIPVLYPQFREDESGLHFEGWGI